MTGSVNLVPKRLGDAVQEHPKTDERAALRPMHAQLTSSEYLRQMWNRRSFAVAMPVEEVRSSHQDTLLGNIWHIANPLLTVGVYYVVFGIFFKANRGIDNYLLWLSIGVFTYGLTTRAVVAGATSITNNLGLMRAMRFPRALLPVSTVLGRVLTFGFELTALGVVTLLSGVSLRPNLLLLPVIVALHSGLNLGLAFIAARLNDTYRDVQQLIPFVFRLLMYLSGVMFPVRRFLGDSNAPGLISRAIALNPMVQLLDLYRWAYLGTTVDASRLVQLVLTVLLVLVFGFRFFRVKELAYGRA